MKKATVFIVFFLLIVSIGVTAHSHPGRTDARGGHRDNRNASGLGSYHFHCGGNPPHLHAGGTCPFVGTSPAVIATPAAAATPIPTSTPTPTPAPMPITVTIDGMPVAFETPPQLIDDRVMVQIRAIAERLGCSVVWDPGTQTSYINQPNVPLQRLAKRGNDINVYVNNKRIDLSDRKPIMHNGYVLIPSRGVIEALGYSVTWDSAARAQRIETSS